MSLVFDAVSLAYGRRTVFDRFDLTIAAGERVALLGPSGAGKTSLFRLAFGGVAPQAGRVVVDGVDIAHARGRALRAVRAGIAIVPQAHGLVEALSVEANVLAGTLGRHGTFGGLRTVFAPRPAERALAHDALARVGLADRVRDPAYALSGGQRQRVAVARAIAGRSALVLADEPAASLDPDNAVAVVQLLLDDARERAATLVCTLHQPDLAAGFDRTITLAA